MGRGQYRSRGWLVRVVAELQSRRASETDGSQSDPHRIGVARVKSTPAVAIRTAHNVESIDDGVVFNKRANLRTGKPAKGTPSAACTRHGLGPRQALRLETQKRPPGQVKQLLQLRSTTC
jgi:hypothetical protein